MAVSILHNAMLLFHDRDLSGVSNTVGLDLGVEGQDKTPLNQDTRISEPGLKTAGFSAEGFFDPATDKDLFDAQTVADKLISIAHSTADEAAAYVLRAMAGEYQPIGGSMGDLASYSLAGSATNATQRGQILFHSASETATGTGAHLNLGAAANAVTAVLHVFSASGTSPTLDVSVESDSADDFSGAEIERIAFTQATGRTAERKATGSVADTWWRVNFTIGGTSSPDFGFAVILILE